MAMVIIALKHQGSGIGALQISGIRLATCKITHNGLDTLDIVSQIAPRIAIKSGIGAWTQRMIR